MDKHPGYTLTAKRGKPNRQIPIGGKIKHVRTGSTVPISADQVEALQDWLDGAGCAGDYALVELKAQPTRAQREATAAVRAKGKADRAKREVKAAKAAATKARK